MIEWFAIRTSDVILHWIIYKKITFLDSNFQVEVEEAENGSSNTTINADFDFTHRFYKLFVYGFKDFLKNYGAM